MTKTQILEKIEELTGRIEAVNYTKAIQQRVGLDSNVGELERVALLLTEHRDGLQAIYNANFL